MNLYVGNLNFDISEGEIRELFEQVGEVANVRLMIDRETGVSKGYGFVEMNDVEEYVIALKTLNGREFGGRNIVVNQGSADSDGGKKPQSRQQQRPNNNSQPNRGYNNQGGGGYNNDRPRGNYNNQGGSGYNNDRPRGNYNNQGGSGYNNDRPRSNYNLGGSGYNNDRPRDYNQGGGYNNDRPRNNYNQGGSGYDNNRGYDSNRPPRDNNGYNNNQNSSYNRNTNESRPNEGRDGIGGYNKESSSNREGGYDRTNYSNREGVEPRKFVPRDENPTRPSYEQSSDRDLDRKSSFSDENTTEKLPKNNLESMDENPDSSKNQIGAKRPRARVAAPEKVEKRYSNESKDEASE
jgi:RNA recognition motif-containing protein